MSEAIEFLNKLEQLLKEYEAEIEIDYGYYGNGEVYIRGNHPSWDVYLGFVSYIDPETIATARRKLADKDKEVGDE